MTGVPAAATVAAVITAFDPGESLLTVAASVVGQVGAVVVVDDGSTATGTGQVLESCERLGCTVVRRCVNGGVAAALNSGVTQALSASPAPSDILTLDQDSVVPEGYVEAAVAARAAAERHGIPVAMVAPERVAGLPGRLRGSRDGVLLGGEPVQSGLLVPTAVLRSVGLFDESLFIDGVDTEFYLRCLDAGLVVVLVPGTTLSHRLGSRHPVRFLGRPVVLRGSAVELTHARAFRYYFIARNRIALVRAHGRRHPGWAAGQLLGVTRHLLLVTVLVPGRAERARAVRRGIRDGLRGVGGPAPPGDVAVRRLHP